MPSPSLRPAIHDSKTGRITVTLNDDDLAFSYRCGLARYQSQRNGRNYDAAFRNGHGARNDIEGAIAEAAFALLCGVELAHDNMVLVLPEWCRARGPSGGMLTDVQGVEIRATKWKTGGLFIHKNSSRDGAQKLNTTFVLALVDEWYYYPDTTFKTGDPAIDEGLAERKIPLYGHEVVFAGWCLGHEANEVFEGCTHQDFRVPQDKLHPMIELAPKFFNRPPNEFDRLNQETDELADTLL
jgi:hypothetical protein